VCNLFEMLLVVVMHCGSLNNKYIFFLVLETKYFCLVYNYKFGEVICNLVGKTFILNL
jgi:hypothetical protein